MMNFIRNSQESGGDKGQDSLCFKSDGEAFEIAEKDKNCQKSKFQKMNSLIKMRHIQFDIIASLREIEEQRIIKNSRKEINNFSHGGVFY